MERLPIVRGEVRDAEETLLAPGAPLQEKIRLQIVGRQNLKELIQNYQIYIMTTLILRSANQSLIM